MKKAVFFNKLFRRGAGGWLAVALIAVGTGCIDGDNPTALADLNPIAEFEVEGIAETYRELAINIEVTEGGAHLEMSQAQLVVQSSSGSRSFELTEDEHGFGAHVTFYEEGTHHIEMMGTPVRHRIGMDMGDIEIMVLRYHEVAGPYWVEFATEPAPIERGQVAHLEVFVYALTLDGSRGAPLAGLMLSGEIHHPDGDESIVAMEDAGDGEYEGEFEFVEGGEHEFHIEIDDGVSAFEAEFHFLVVDPDADNDTTDPGTGGEHHG